MLSEEEKMHSTLAQVYHAINQNNVELIDKILPDRYINSQISSNDYLKSHEPKLIGCTPLHLALGRWHEKTFDHLLDRGADFTIKNVNGSTVLHEAIKFIYEDFNNSVWESRFELINSILQAYLSHENVDTLNEINPCDNNDISHFHIACITDNVEIVKLFLDHGTDVNEAVRTDSPHFPGYTPLHFAERFYAFKTVKFLLERGADVNLKDARGMTPIHTFLEQHLKTVDLIHFGKPVPPYVDVEKIDEGVELNLKIMCPENRNGYDAKFIDHIGLSCLHVACTMKNNSGLVEKLLTPGININRAVKSNSPIWSGYTALHFAAKSYNVETMKLLIRNEAALPKYFWFHDIFPNYTIEVVHSIMSAHPNWNDVLFSDSVTKVLDFIYAMRSVENFRLFLNNMENVNDYVPSDSALLPCYTPLHLAVIFTARPIDMGTRREDDEALELGLVQEVLNRGADQTESRRAYCTALWDAFYSEKLRVVHLLLEHYNLSINVAGFDWLSTLHIACAAKNTNVVKRLLENHANPNLPTRYIKHEWFNTYVICESSPRIFHDEQGYKFDINGGSTPLHVAVASRSYDIVKMLLDHNADRHAKDCKGFTPIHYLLLKSSDYDSGRIANLLLFWRRNVDENVEDRSTDINCNYLHVASSFRRNNEHVDEAINSYNFLLSSNVNTAITEAIPVSPGLKTFFSFIDKLLIYVGKGEEGKTNTAVAVRTWLETNVPLIDNFLMRLGIVEESGRKDRKIKYILDHYMGYTPLDFAIENDNELVVKILIQKGADIFAKKPNGSTPFYKLLSKSQNTDMLCCLQDIIKSLKSDDIMKKRMEEDSGLTMMHLAISIMDVEMVRSLLDDGADVNARTRMNSPIWPGYTPLHVLLETAAALGFRHKSYQTVIDEILDLLLDKQVDVLLENAGGESAIYLFHRLSYSRYEEDWRWELMAAKRLRKLIKNVKTFEKNTVNYQGITLFHLACKYNEVNIVESYLEEHNNYLNLRIDYFNDEFGGCTPLLFILASNWTRWCTEKECFATIDLLLDKGADISAEDYHGNNAMHCAVSHEWVPSAQQYSYLIEKLKQKGCDINHKNNEGRTPLHTAAENHNIKAVTELLNAGADIFGVDAQNNNALHYAVLNEYSYFSAEEWADLIQSFVRHECPVDHQNNRGKTPLHIATENRHHAAVSALLLAGADWNIVDENSRTAFAYVLEPTFLPRGDWVGHSKNVVITYIMHLCKLEATESTISEIHRDVRSKLLDKFENKRIDVDDLYCSDWFYEESKKLSGNLSTASRIKFFSGRSSSFSL